MVSWGVEKYENDKTYNGYTLFTPCASQISGKSTYLIDMKGMVVHKWDTPFPGHLARFLPNGNLFWSGRKGKPLFEGAAGGTGIIAEFNWDGEIIWKYENPALHHDHFRLSNGNTILIAWERVPDSIAKKVKIKSKIDEKLPLWGDMIFEVNTSGETIWEWHAHEYLDPEEDIGELKEWTHCNAVFETIEHDLLVSFRQTNMVGIIDKKTGDWKWKYGKEILGHQHDPTQLENGNILIFDNIMRNSPSRSRVIEVDPKENKIVWEYSDKRYLGFFSDAISGAQRLPNGNTLICEGQRGRIFEVTKEKEIVWDYKSPFYNPNNIFRAYRYGPEYSGFKGKKLDISKYQWINHLYIS